MLQDGTVGCDRTPPHPARRRCGARAAWRPAWPRRRAGESASPTGTCPPAAAATPPAPPVPVFAIAYPVSWRSGHLEWHQLHADGYAKPVNLPKVAPPLGARVLQPILRIETVTTPSCVANAGAPAVLSTEPGSCTFETKVYQTMAYLANMTRRGNYVSCDKSLKTPAIGLASSVPSRIAARCALLTKDAHLRGCLLNDARVQYSSCVCFT